jgi:EmrB/QacA subfamily drug resistance transporter
MTQPAAATTDTPQLTHRQIMVVLTGLMLGMLMAALDQTIVSTALPTIVGELGGLDHYSWVVTAYLLSSTASTPLYGKISDLYGRRSVFQFAIVVFLIGSLLAGASQEMWQLIATRALQGLGAGGLIALALAIVGDIIPPRERGRYQGYFGAVFAVSSVAGPLLGGFFVDQLSWRWVFYINLPVGIVALIVTSIVLRVPIRRREHAIDYVGAALLVAGVSALLLVTVQGRAWGWTSGSVIGLAAISLAALSTFLWWENRHHEPILPLRLFHNRVFTISNAIGFVLGLVMFGAIIFLPLYLQIVDGVSATESGLRLLPLMIGLIGASVISGRIISAIGRYKMFPIIGTGFATVGLALLSMLDRDTPAWQTGLFMFVLGVGLGQVMQVLVLAVQNSVDRSDMGVATSSSAFFRSMGGAFGTAIFGAVLNARLAHWLDQLLPGGAPDGIQGQVLGSPAAIEQLPPAVHDAVVEAFVRSLHTVFVVAVPISLVAFALTWFLPEIHLREGGQPAPAEDAEAVLPD